MTVLEVLRRFAYTLEPIERARVLDWLRRAERLLEPPPGIRFTPIPDQIERRRRALLPRPNVYYPGGPDYTGRAA